MSDSIKYNVLSIDIGSVAVSVVELSSDGKLIGKHYSFHNGQPALKLKDLLKTIDLKGIASVVTPSETSLLTDKVRNFDSQSCFIKAAKSIFSDLSALLIVGAGRFQLMHFDTEGKFTYSATNTSCAAGTGSFLDQQAGRLSIGNASELSHMANSNRDEMPDIASRCSVFAKTDLIHAQQAGYSMESICDSLCRGLAQNIVDTLFDGAYVASTVIFAGGVSKNTAVKRHLATFVKSQFLVHEDSHLFAAIGAGLMEIERISGRVGEWERMNKEARKEIRVDDIIAEQTGKKEYASEPLSLKLSHYPDFKSKSSFIFKPVRTDHPSDVQVDIYGNNNIVEQGSYLGVDIGSTSTKAMLTGSDNKPFAGFYTYTAGQPLNAIRAIFESIIDLDSQKIVLDIKAVGTTGSGRKFIGAIIGADMVIDEITTHARAAYELNPETDTIIEIGGQDAKFTLMKNGRVTFSKMNSVCAAGTGSFIEEQALKLGVSLKDYSSLAENARAPLASDRCTVFMERDINHYLNQAYNRSEILAAVLHSVRDNYLKKVATESNLGSCICFQGATAKNKALVAAFESKLEKEIFVSEYCHLTGALGTALLLADEYRDPTSFRGFDIINEKIKLSSEICELCNNRCRISIAEVRGEKVAYGFLCGREYDNKKYVDKNTSGFDLLKARKKNSRVLQPVAKEKPLIGIPAALHIFDELKFWTVFFNELGYRVLTSENMPDPLSSGKRLAGAEFCAPMHAMYGHVNWLADKCDYIFIPSSLENRESDDPYYENYCYYTQFSPPVVSFINESVKNKTITPLLYFEKGEKYVLDRLEDGLGVLNDKSLSRKNLESAWRKAEKSKAKERQANRELFVKNFEPEKDLSVVLLGRPYLVLADSLNKGIPGIFGSMGVRCFYQDMIESDGASIDELTELLKSMPWHFAHEILFSARMIIETDGLYPVFITGFKCAPDSFVIEYFQKLMDASGKPYLILQIDEHDSNVGYETRIEAALRSFRTHYSELSAVNAKGKFKIGFPTHKLNKERLLLYPNWDQLGGPLLAANFRRFGYNTELLEHTELGIQKAMSTNTGQCLPLNIIAQDGIEYIKKKDLEPSKTSLWITETRLTCNIRMYPQFIKTIFENYGDGMEDVDIYSGEVAHNEISIGLTYFTYFAYMFSGLIRRLGCKLRPYEITIGETNKAIVNAIETLTPAFEGKKKLDQALKKALEPFYDIKIKEADRPLVAIFGDFFVRDNDVMNQGLIYDIERFGGEVHTTPYNEFYNLSYENVMRRRLIKDGPIRVAGLRGLTKGLKLIQNRYYRHFEPFLGLQKPSLSPLRNEENLLKFKIDKYHSGESYDNLLKIFHITNLYPETRLFVQTNPAFCCPSLITEAMKSEIRKHTGIPIVTITYDGTTEKKNDVLAPYLNSL